MNFTHEFFLLEAYFEFKSYERCVERWRDLFPNDPAPVKSVVDDLGRRFRDTGSIEDRRRSGRPKLITQDFIHDVQERMARWPRKSVRRLSQQVGVSIGATHKALKLAKLHPYRVKVVQELLPPDLEKRRRYCEWFCAFTDNNVAILDKTFFTDTASSTIF